MPLKFAPPGSRRFRGRIRAQMAKGVAVIQQILNYNAKLGAMAPPLNFLVAGQVVAFQQTQSDMQDFLDLKN